MYSLDGLKENYIFHEAASLGWLTLKQFRAAMEQDYVVKGALMPDCHLGYTLPIGGVVATEDYILPIWVGFDIGCGALSAKTNFNSEEVMSKANGIWQKIHSKVPTGHKHNEKRDLQYEKFISELSDAGKDIWESKGGSKQLGTLGAGNHFIEIGKGVDDDVYITIHSGSRGIGHGIATHYIRAAHPENKVKSGNHALKADSEVGKGYLRDQEFCLKFALANRERMMVRVQQCIEDALGVGFGSTQYGVQSVINQNHNHVEYDILTNVYTHRKGATHADNGMPGVILGNMRDGVYITRGLGNPESLNSSSHGAGRAMSRNKAKKTLDVALFKSQMAHIVSGAGKNQLDEAPGAYKDFDEVMEEQDGVLLEIEDHVTPMINVKGQTRRR